MNDFIKSEVHEDELNTYNNAHINQDLDDDLDLLGTKIDKKTLLFYLENENNVKNEK